MINVLNLGAGVQSTTVLLMSVKGILPKLDCALFADTKWEPAAVYRHLEWLSEQAESAGIPVNVVFQGHIKQDALISQVRGEKRQGQRWAAMPYRTVSPKGKLGMIRRQCTYEYKIRPIDRFIRLNILGLPKFGRAPKEQVINQWFGISADEISRVRSTPDRWRTFCYPLINIPGQYLSTDFTRDDCHAWLREHYPDRDVPRSACIACPFHSNAEWRHMKETSPDEFADAVDFDRRIRKCGGMRGDMFVHQSGIPLDQVDLRPPEKPDAIQDDLFGNECFGMCNV